MVLTDKKKVFRVVLAILIVFCSFATLPLGYYVDENGLLAIYQGIYKGQHMFVDSWEALQTGGVLAFPLFALYYNVLSSMLSNVGIGLVLYMRVMYMLCRLFLAVYLYNSIKKSQYKEGAFAAAIFYYLFVVGWLNFSYKSYCDMAIVLCICFIFRFAEMKNYWYFCGLGIATCIAIVAYPTMIIFAIFEGLTIIVLVKRTDLKMKALAIFILTCVILGVMYLSYLQVTTGLGEVLSQLQYIGDQDYDYSMPIRLLRMLAMYIAFGIIAYAPVLVLSIFKRKKAAIGQKEYLLLGVYWIVFFLGICLCRISSISNSRYVYALIVLFFWFPYLAYDKSKNALLWIVFSISVVAQLIWAASTNQDIAVPGYMSVSSMIAVILLILTEKKQMRIVVDALIVFGVFFSLIWVPESNGGMAHIFEPRICVESGALQGVYVKADYYELDAACYKLLNDHVDAEDNLMVTFGSNSTAYINNPGKIAGHTIYDRTQVNTKVLTFWEKHPEHFPKYVLINKSNSKYENFENGETGQYILNRFTEVVDSIGDVVLLAEPIQ